MFTSHFCRDDDDEIDHYYCNKDCVVNMYRTALVPGLSGHEDFKKKIGKSRVEM